jgi:hypothetical protein
LSRNTQKFGHPCELLTNAQGAHSFEKPQLRSFLPEVKKASVGQHVLPIAFVNQDYYYIPPLFGRQALSLEEGGPKTI